MSEGGQAVSGKYWFHSIVPERTVLAPCDMKTEGEFKCLSIHIFYRQKSVYHEQKRWNKNVDRDVIGTLQPPDQLLPQYSKEKNNLKIKISDGNTAMKKCYNLS